MQVAGAAVAAHHVAVVALLQAAEHAVAAGVGGDHGAGARRCRPRWGRSSRRLDLQEQSALHSNRRRPVLPSSQASPGSMWPLPQTQDLPTQSWVGRGARVAGLGLTDAGAAVAGDGVAVVTGLGGRDDAVAAVEEEHARHAGRGAGVAARRELAGGGAAVAAHRVCQSSSCTVPRSRPGRCRRRWGAAWSCVQGWPGLVQVYRARPGRPRWRRRLPSVVLPSSHCSLPWMMPSPHTWTTV